LTIPDDIARYLAAPILSRAEVLALPSPVPAGPGAYGWWFRELPADIHVRGCITRDGLTLLYSYTTQGGASATPFIETGLFNTGNAPYAQNPIYLNYGATPYGIGSTDFSIY